MGSSELDVVVVGGGPAGATLARLLAERGRTVALVDHGRAHYSGPFETVLASTRSAWSRMGLLDGLADGLAGGVQPDPLRHGAIWGSPQLDWRQGDEAGLLLRRGPFDQALRDAAKRAGARVFEAAKWRRTDEGLAVDCGPVGDCGPEGDANRPRTLHAKLMAFATGRAQVADLPDVQPLGPKTTAVTLLGEPDANDRKTAVVEAISCGWIWTHVPEHGEASAAILVDQARLQDQKREVALHEILAQANGPAGRLREPRVAHANDATMWRRPDTELGLLLGDAAATIDPLASQGVEKAVSAAEHAALALHTALDRPAWWPRLRAFHRRWEHGLQDAHGRAAQTFYRQENRFGDQPFWRTRSGPATAEAATEAPLQVASTVDKAPALMRHGHQIIEVDGAVDRATGEELARIGRVPVASVLKLFQQPTTIARAVARASQDPGLFVLTPHEVHEGILQLAARRWLVP